jgi:glycosyltransferase involved in cell wall biosynthesis
MTNRFDRIDVIVPVLNEEDMVRTFYERISRVPLPLHFIFVDNASTDRTREIVRTFPDSTLIEHEKNEGYGGSIIDGIAHSTAEAFVIIDADCEYPPEAIPDLVAALERSPVVYASRFLETTGLNMPFLRKVGNRTITALFNALFGQSLTDLYTGCKALRRSAVEGLILERKGFEHVLELAARISLRGVSISEVPVVYELRRVGTSKMSHLAETLKFLYLLLRYRLGG